MIKNQKVLSLFRLTMINIIAVDSLRNLSITAAAGWMSITFYVIAAFLFLLPCTLLTAEMATHWPKTGGIYLWTKIAFGRKIGFIVLWLQWIYNLVWFPSICGFFASIIAYLIAPLYQIAPEILVTSPWYMIGMSLCMFWLATYANCYGLKMSSSLSNLGAILGTIFPMLLIIVLALSYFIAHPTQFNLPTQQTLIPNISNIHNWGFYIAVMFSLFGLEMSAIHADNVNNPRRNFPLALTLSSIIILGSLILSNIAIFSIYKDHHQSPDIIVGLMQAFSYFFNQFHIPWMLKVIAVTLILGAFTTTSTWIMGLSRAVMVASHDEMIPPKFAALNRHQAPYKILIAQAFIFTAFCSSYIFLPSVNSAYWYLSDLTAELAMIAYIAMFVAAIKLRLKHKQDAELNAFTIHENPIFTILIATLGIFGSLLAIVIGFFPTSDIEMSAFNFDLLLVGGIIISLIIPFVWQLRKTSHP